MPSPRRDFSKEKPVCDELFDAYLGHVLLRQDSARIATVEQLADEDDWKIEKITYSAGYGNERAIAYLFLPKKAKPPYQTVLFFPGSNALLLRKFAMYPDIRPRRRSAQRSRRASIPSTRAPTSAATAWSLTSPTPPAPGAITSSCG